MKSPVSQRRAAVAALLLVPTLSACGFGAQTDQPYQAAVGSNDRSGEVYVLNAVIISDTDGAGTFAGSMVNTTDADIKLTSVTGAGISADTATGQAITIPANGLENFGIAGETVPPAKLTVTGDGVVPGGYVSLTFTFSAGKAITMRVLVSPVTEDYEDVPLPQPKKAATDGATETPSSDATDAAE